MEDWMQEDLAYVQEWKGKAEEDMSQDPKRVPTKTKT